MGCRVDTYLACLDEWLAVIKVAEDFVSLRKKNKHENDIPFTSGMNLDLPTDLIACSCGKKPNRDDCRTLPCDCTFQDGKNGFRAKLLLDIAFIEWCYQMSPTIESVRFSEKHFHVTHRALTVFNEPTYTEQYLWAGVLKFLSGLMHPVLPCPRSLPRRFKVRTTSLHTRWLQV